MTGKRTHWNKLGSVRWATSRKGNYGEISPTKSYCFCTKGMSLTDRDSRDKVISTLSIGFAPDCRSIPLRYTFCKWFNCVDCQDQEVHRRNGCRDCFRTTIARLVVWRNNFGGWKLSGWRSRNKSKVSTPLTPSDAQPRIYPFFRSEILWIPRTCFLSYICFRDRMS